jgi:hypothetical protein
VLSFLLIFFDQKRALADTDNRGKLNLPEFRVAMGLIYRSEFKICTILCFCVFV